MLTHGAAVLLTPDDDLSRRIPGYGRVLGEYLKALCPALDAAYAAFAGADGERLLIISLAPGGRSQLWVMQPNVGDLPAETQLIAKHVGTLHVGDRVLKPVLLGDSYWVGPEPVPVHGLGLLSSYMMPQDLIDCGNELLAAGGDPTFLDVVDAYWDRQARRAK